MAPSCDTTRTPGVLPRVDLRSLDLASLRG